MADRFNMNSRRLIVELILALALAWFALAVGEAYADGIHCERGLPALSSVHHATQNQDDGVAPGFCVEPGSDPGQEMGHKDTMASKVGA